MAVLEIEGLRAGYGELPVLHGIDMAIEEQEAASVLGLNGAGKTTLMLTIAGRLPVWEGDIRYQGESIVGLETAERVAQGIVLVPEGRRVFSSLSVENNLRVGGWVQRHNGAAEAIDEVFELFPRLRERSGQVAGTLSGGEQQMLALGRALMARPRLLLVDEASLGLAPVLVSDVFRRLREIADSGVTVLLVEQNVGVLSVIDRAFVMEKGQIVYSGTSQEIGSGEEIRKSYLGAA